ncbi:hypothetical protein [Sphingobium sp.]|uniref:alpha/beta fold hydrolase n=1 Tax=Sphingobium sp. TaxID=1912891 RepID=UPI002C06FB58|nr:hypothetical protein [Sphingobium sp.]HUD91487.1 hypothetical protein [Sphingobium sp.]
MPRWGRTGRVVDADTTQDMTIEAMADRAIQTLSAPAIVIGFSMGGYVARSIAYRAPGKVKDGAHRYIDPRACAECNPNWHDLPQAWSGSDHTPPASGSSLRR